jgi:hypothetical protein
LRNFVSLSLFFCASFLSAQSTPIPAVPVDPTTLASHQLEFLSRTIQERNAEETRQAAAAREVEIARVQFREKANQFVALWGDFASRLNDKQMFDVKLAKKLAKAFHELETSEGWPVRDQTVASNRSK